MKNKLIIFAITIITLSSCTKYENGPRISFRSKEKKLCKSWKYNSKFFLDSGISQTTNLPDSVLTFSTTKEYSDNKGGKGTWDFTGTVDLEIISDQNGNTTITKWEILRLANKELWLKKNRVEYHFIPQ